MKYLPPLMLAVLASLGTATFADEVPTLTSEEISYTKNSLFDAQSVLEAVETLFASDSSLLSVAAKATLKPFVNRLKYSPSTMFTVAGYSDARGSKNRNLVLSLARAKVVRDFLIDHGIRPENIRLVAHGESRAAVNIQHSDRLVEDRRVVVTAIGDQSTTTLAASAYNTPRYGTQGEMP